MKDFRELKVWERAHVLVLAAYQATREFPADELYGLTRQIRSASASIPTNIAEGCGRSRGDFLRFLRIAMGSASELEYLLLLARDLVILPLEPYGRLAESTREVKRMLAALISKVASDRLTARSDDAP